MYYVELYCLCTKQNVLYFSHFHDHYHFVCLFRTVYHIANYTYSLVLSSILSLVFFSSPFCCVVVARDVSRIYY